MARIFITGAVDWLGHLAAEAVAEHGHQVVLHALQCVPRAEQQAATLHDQATAFRELSRSRAVDDA